MKKKDSEVIWIGRAIETLYLKAEEKDLPLPGASQINIVLKMWELGNNSIKSIENFVEVTKKNDRSGKKAIDTTHIRLFSTLSACGVIQKSDAAYTLNMNYNEKDEKRFAWLGSVIKGFKENEEKDNKYKLGERKLKIFMWIWEHQKNLPVSTRDFSVSMNLSSEGKSPSIAVVNTLKRLIELGFLKKEKKEYSLIEK